MATNSSTQIAFGDAMNPFFALLLSRYRTASAQFGCEWYCLILLRAGTAAGLDGAGIEW